MNADLWDRAKRLFLSAADLPAEERVRFLDENCGDDPDLRAEVDSLLTADEKHGEGISAAVETEAALLFDSPRAGERLGPYRIERELGRGGMGAVYLASRDDDQFRKRVAIKVVKRGMDTAEVLERFRYERQILANLEHPFIAGLYDGGTTADGRPYFVMEYVEGQAVDVFCRERALDVKARCRLFLRICEAVAHAHRNLVVHRDLKPINIFITPDGTPKLLDFGIAKLLGDRTNGTTAPMARHFTPEYASPEQVRGLPVATASDVYSLGAVLYEMLSGKRPHVLTGRSATDLERMICETDPPRLSEAAPELRRQLAGDLDAIVSKAMRKEPQLRYASVEHFAADVKCHLSGCEVVAHRGSMMYRGGKWLRRNRAAIAIGAMFAALLIGGSAIATREAIQATRAKKQAELERVRAQENQARAEASQKEAEASQREAELQRLAAETQRGVADRRFGEVRKLAGKFLVDFHDAIAKLPGSTAARKMVVETGLEYYDGLVRDAQGNRDLLEEIARGYDRLGDVQGNPYYANLGDVAGALASYKKALAVREKIVDASPAFLADRVKGHTRIAQVLTAQGKMQDAERYLKEALAFGAGTAAGKDYEVRAALAGLYNTFGALQISKVAYGEAEKFLLKQLEIAQQLAKLGREPGAEQIALSVAHTKLGEAYTQMDRMPEAADHLRQALELDQKLAAAEPNSLPRMRKLFITNVLLGRVLRSRSGSQLGKPGEVEQVLDTGATIADKMMAADPNNSLAVMDVVMGRTAQGDWQKNAGQIQAALASYRKALDAVVRLDNPHAGYGSLDALTQTHQRMAAGLGKANQPDTALDHLRKAEEYLARADSVNPGSNRGAMRKAEILGSRADVYGAQKKWADAITNLKAVIAIFEGQRSKDPKNEALLSEQPALYAQLADCYASAGQTDNAARAMRTALDRAGEIAAKRPLVAEEERDRQTNLAKLSQWDRPAK